MPERDRRTEPFAYLLIVEDNQEQRESLLNTVQAPNCAIDVAQDEDEAVRKALQHRPQMIIVKRHESIEFDLINPPRVNTASRICQQARLRRSTRLITHSDVGILTRSRGALMDFTHVSHLNVRMDAEVWRNISQTRPAYHANQVTMIEVNFSDQCWRREWYTHSSPEVESKFLSDHLHYWLGWGPSPLYPQAGCWPLPQDGDDAPASRIVVATGHDN